MPPPDPNPFVFHDPAGRRWSRMQRVAAFGVLVVFIALLVFVEALFVTPELRLPPSVRQLKGQLRAIQEQMKSSGDSLDWQRYLKSDAGMERAIKLRERLQASAAEPKKAAAGGTGEVRAAFYADWDPYSLESLEKHAGSLTHVCAEWAVLADASGEFTVSESASLQKVIASRGLVFMPILSNLTQRDWTPEGVEGLAMGAAPKRAAFVKKLVEALEKSNAGGVLLEWEQLDPAYRNELTALVEEIAKALRSVGKEVWLTVPMGIQIDVFDITRLSASVSRFVAVLHDESSRDESPGPIASQDWFEGWLEVIQGYGNPQQWIASIGVYGYDWTAGAKEAEEISFRDAMSRASYAGIKKVEIAAPSFNPIFSYEEPGGSHTVSFLDAITFLNQLRAVRDGELGGIAIQRLGSEDPQMWDVLALRDVNLLDTRAVESLSILRTGDNVANVGRGEMVTVDDTRDDGARTLNLNTDGRVSAVYTNFPTYPSVFHEGAADPHLVTLTFDDGPDPEWTPKILDILRAYQVKAAFFVVGKQAEDHPELIREIIEEGHEIGNHTYTHSNLGELSSNQITIELNATQRLLESITGRSTTLFRPPYQADSRPTNVKELTPLKLVQDDLGYLIVLENIDPEDWAKPGADEILRRIKEQREEGNIILLHDAGGDRRQTVEALPKIIDYLRARGDEIVPLSDLLHIPRDELMPKVQASEQKVVRIVTGVGFSIWHRVEQFVWAFMICATGLVVLRAGVIAWLAFRHHRHPFQDVPDFCPPVSIVIAAYNEEKVIERTLRSVLDTDYKGGLEVVVVDDGSTDKTAELVERMARVDQRVRLSCQPNGGKSVALRRGVSEARSEILVFLDADTHFDRRTLDALVAPLADEAVGAVSGHAEVGNLRTFLARCQALEYTCGFNLDRRAYAVWNCITVVPGAVSALRRSALEAAGGFSLDTLAEDTDLTLSMHKAGYRIAYAHNALAYTEAPETLATLAKQRFRWAFGTLQCLWKHRDLVFNSKFGALGWFALPSIWFCQIFLVALMPVVDAMLLFSLFTGGAGTLMGTFFAAFLAMDLALAALACYMDKKPIWEAWRILPMRMIYRPLLSWVVWRSLLEAAKGAWVSWGKLERTASVEVQAS